jgi:hypothetical protein
VIAKHPTTREHVVAQASEKEVVRTVARTEKIVAGLAAKNVVTVTAEESIPPLVEHEAVADVLVAEQ